MPNPERNAVDGFLACHSSLALRGRNRMFSLGQ
jgi:hypothetical protein